MNAQKLPIVIFSIVLYAVAGALAIYAIWAAAHCAGIISEAVKAGQLSVSENIYDVVSFYMANCAQYFVFTLLLAAAGTVLAKQNGRNKPSGLPAPEHTPNSGDDELDDWFDSAEETE